MLRYSLFVFFIAILLGINLSVGCSGGDAAPITPADNAGRSAPIQASGSGRILWGIWNIHFDPVGMTAVAVPARNIQAHFNVAAMLIPPECDDCVLLAPKAFDPVTRIMDIDVTLRNPSPIPGRDVRGILHTNDAGHLLTNPDAWTGLWDVPGGANLNPFRAFAKSEANRVFDAFAQHTENYLVYIPKPPKFYEITFAVDASWPGNCKEPYAIDDFTQLAPLASAVGSSATLEVTVRDWQDDVTGVSLVAPEITGQPFAAFTYMGGELWSLEITNNTGAAAGDYEVRLIAASPNAAGIALYHYVTITIVEGTPPTVLTVIPDSANAGDDVIGAVVSGTDFEGPGAQVKLKMDGEPDIVAENVVVLSSAAVTCDISIPNSAELGPYDVEVVNGNGLTGVGADLFNVLCPAPVCMLDISPPWLNFSPNDVCRVGDYAYVAADVNGLHIFDISDSANPQWVGAVPASDEAMGVDVRGGFACVALDMAGMMIVDVTTPNMPVIVTTVDTTGRANAVYSDTLHAYVADSGQGLQIIDIDPPGSASIVKTVPLTGGLYDIDVQAGHAFLAGSDGLHIVDIDPVADASLVNTVDTDSAEGVDIESGYAYVACKNYGLRIVNVVPPETAAVIKTVDTPGLAYDAAYWNGYCFVAIGTQGLTVVDVDPIGSADVINTVSTPYAQAVAAGDGYMYVADQYGGLFIADVSPPAAAYIIAEADTPGYARSVAIDGDYVYTGVGFAGLMIFDAGNPSSTAIVNRVDIDGAAEGLTVQDGYAYVISNTEGLIILDVTYPESAYLVNSIPLTSQGCTVAVEGGYACAAHNTGIDVIDIDPPADAHLVTFVDLQNNALGVCIDGGYAYVGAYDSGLKIIDIDPPESAHVYNSVPTTYEAYGVAVAGGYAYVCVESDGVDVIDIDPPDSAYLVINVPTSTAHDVAVLGDYAYVADHAAGITVIDISNPGSAYVYGSHDTPGIAQDVAVVCGYAYLANRRGGLRVVELW